MAYDRDEMNRRRRSQTSRSRTSQTNRSRTSRNTRKRRPTDAQRAAGQRTPQSRKRETRKGGGLGLVVALEILAVVILAIVLLSWNSGGKKPVKPNDTVQTSPTQSVMESQTVQTEPVPVPTTDPDAPTTVIHIAAAGDLNINDATVSAGRTSGGYDYTQVFQDVAPLFAKADLSLLNFEGNLVGSPYGTESTSAPQELVQALDAMGVDLVQMANSFSVTHGVKGLSTTLDNLRAAGLEPVGAVASAEEFQKTKGYTIINVKGIRIAFVAFTKGMSGLSLPAGNEDCVNLLYTDYATTYQEIDTDGIERILDNVATEKPDLTIALVHWGSEYKDSVTSNQKKIAKLMKENGVDVILGTHSHMLHQVDFDPLTGALVAYSLGDFFGEAQRRGTNYSVVLDLEITRDNVAGTTRVTNYSYTPIYTLTKADSSSGQMRVVRLEQAIAAYDENFVGKVSDSTYEDMQYNLTRVSERINPKPAEEEKK